MDKFLKTHVENGKVDYAAIKANPGQLNELINRIARAQKFEGDNEKAFLINTYNILVIKGIVDNYPIEGPLKIDGFFDKKAYRFRGKMISLNELEKDILYKQFPDPRLHFALVCAANGCPKLGSFGYNGGTVEEQLEQQTRNVINNPEFIRLNGPKATVSKIFDWYVNDFGGTEGVIPFVQKYLLKKIKLQPEYDFYEYDWNLNDQK
jgi:hypothetical protein